MMNQDKIRLLQKLRTQANTIQAQHLSETHLSCSQNRIWYLEQLFPNTATYNMYVCFKLSQPLNLAYAEQAFNLIVARHAPLRTQFVFKGEQVAQVIAPTLHLKISQHTAAASDLETLISQLSKVPFNLTMGPLVQLYLIDLEDGTQVMLLTMHHLISDGWSLSLFFAEFSQIYTTLLNDETPVLGELPIDYLDYVTWQETQNQQASTLQQLDFWKKIITNRTDRLNLPTLKAVQTTELCPPGKRLFFTLNQALFNGLKQYAQGAQVTLFMLLFSIFSATLFRHTRQTDLAIGTPIANRKRKEFEKLIGLFVNTLVLRVNMTPEMPFSELLAQVKTMAQGAYANQDIPFERIVELLQPKRDLNSSPLFSSVFVFQNTAPYIPEIPGTEITPLFVHNQTCKFDLLCTMAVINNELVAAFEYNADLYDPATIQQLSEHFSEISEQILAHPEVSLGAIPFRCPTSALGNHLSQQAASLPPQILQCFLKSVAQHPQATALLYHSKTLSYQNLNAQANQLAHYLLEKKQLHPGGFIGINLAPSFELIVAILAVLKIGCAYVPLDSKAPSERLQFIIEDSRLSTILSSTDTRESLPALPSSPVILEEIQAKLQLQSTQNPAITIPPTQTAYVIYTSGSTGKPKGVLVSHQNVTRLFSAAQLIYQLSAQDRWCLFHSYAFDFSVWEIWGALFFGGQLLILSDEEKRSTPEFFNLLDTHQITVLNQTPAAFRQLQTEHAKHPETKLSALRYIIFGGDKLDPSTLAPWFKLYGDQQPQLFNMYGITETTVHVTYRQVRATDTALSYSPIGQPLADLTLYLLDHARQPVPPGIVGEIYVGGAGVSSGYLYQEQLTAERFIQNLFGAGRLYKTGDLARQRTNGELEYIGRADEQMKVRGYRMEPGEIEAHIEQHPMVQRCLVKTFQNSLDEAELIAYVVLKPFTFDDTLQKEQVSEWNMVFDEYYSLTESSQADFNISGWLDSYTRQMIPDAQMLEWVDNTVDRILSLHPQSVLEIGCGTGLLLSRIAPHAQTYIGTDLSPKALEYIQKNLLNHRADLAHTRLYHATADDLAQIPNASFDTFILNSVCQYFPNVAYLLDVIEAVLPKIRAGGYLFLGDIRNKALDAIFHSSVAIYNSQSGDLVEKVKKQCLLSLQQDVELTLEPQFFYQLVQRFDRLSQVQILYKKGLATNELNHYRYDVIISVERQDRLSDIVDIHTEAPNTDQISQFLAKNTTATVVRFAQVPYARIAQSVAQHDLLMNSPNYENMKGIKSIVPSMELSVDSIRQLAARSQRRFELIPNLAQADHIDLIFIKEDQPYLPLSLPEIQQQPWTALASNPLAGRFYKEWSLLLRQFLKPRLPGYMIPSKYIHLAEIPLTINGKIDTRALPLPSLDVAQITSQFIAPKTESEKTVALIFQQILDLQNIGRHSHFFELGGHSILATRVIMKLNEQFQLNLPLRLILLKPTVSELAAAIDQIKKDGNDTVLIASADSIALDQETQLATYIAVAPDLPKADASAVFLTGATGFVGTFLLKQLLSDTTATIYCLIRAKDLPTAWHRLETSLSSYGLWDETERTRIIPILGDLSQPYFGLAQTTFSELATKVGAIYHNGAQVNFSYPYSLLKAANVTGTETVLSLASQQSVKPVHFVSTLFVFSDADHENGKPIHEAQKPAYFEQLLLGYTQSKWVAEQLLDQGRERGIPINIFRLGRVSGHSQTGACQTQDFFWSTVRLGLMLRTLPAWERPIDIIPVNTACQAIVALSQLPNTQQNYHLCNPNPLPIAHFFKVLQDIDYQFEVSPLDHWQKKLYQSAQNQTLDDEALSLLSVINQVSTKQPPLYFDNRQTMHALQQLGIHCPSVVEVMGTYCQYFKQIQYFVQSL